jgi:hypothetical protein
VKKLLSKVFGTLLVLYCAGIIIDISNHKDIYQWDFYGYYHCAKAYEAGLNPYDTDAVSQMVQNPVLPYVYPPITLFFFQIFTKLDYNFAFYAYLILKCVLMTGIIFLWRNVFLNKETDLLFYLLCLFSFNATIYLDLRSGNISMLEQFMIWLALFFYLNRKFTFFCITTIAAAIFKIQPILFLFLLLFIEDKNKYKYLIGSFFVFGMIFLATYLFEPHLFSNFIANALNTAKEQGIENPSTFSFTRELSQSLSKITSVSAFSKAYLIFYSIIIMVVISVSWLAYISITNLRIQDEKKWIIFLMCFVYSLICPRFKDYSYIILIVPTYFTIKRVSCIKPYILLFIFTVISAVYVTLPGLKIIVYFLWNYYPLIVAYCLWGLYLCEISHLHKHEAINALTPLI